LNFAGDEEQHPGEAPEDYVVRTACDKARAVLMKIHDEGLEARPVLAADTTVIVKGEILGKPKDAAEAEAFLRAMSGTFHEVRTAVVAGIAPEHLVSDVSVSRVWFKALTDEEIAAYVATSEPYDKAGGYGIQGLAGLFIEKIEGSYTGIMGLPVFETARLLKPFGVKVL
jgi:septum formation protein